MEKDKNPFPQMELFPRLSRVGAFLGRLTRFCPLEAPDYMSEHYHKPRGASESLDEALYDQPVQQERLWD